MKSILISMLLFASQTGCGQSQSQKTAYSKENDITVGGRCEGCEVIYSSPIAFENLPWQDTLPDFFEKGTRLVISGTVYRSDGRTPAPGVVLYVYHTDQKGIYENREGEKGAAGNHGYIKGWVKTNESGQYRLYTLRPARYPDSRAVEHIHPVIKEPGISEYWVDEFVFADDPYLDKNERKGIERGGSGIITLREENGILYGERNIYLGRNVPGYPPAKSK